MSCITTQSSKGHTYYKLSTSKRNGEKVENSKVSVGRFDEKNNCIEIYEAYRDNPTVLAFIEKQRALGTAVKPFPLETLYTADDIRNATIHSVGETAIIREAAERSGLEHCVLETFGKKRGGALLALAMYMAVKGDPLMYCRLWMEGNDLDIAPAKDLDSRRISELLRSITIEESDSFYSTWAHYAVEENDYLALDITSHSTWSELMGIAGYGYNRDHDSLAQINSCLVCGEKSRMPVAQETYEGEIKDISTLRNMLCVHGSHFLDSAMIVTDKGFASKSNIAAMLDGPLKTDFLTSLSFVMNFPREAIEKVRGEIDKPMHTISIGNDILQGMALPEPVQWPGCPEGTRVNVFVYHNRKASLKSEEDLNVRLSLLYKLIREDPEKACSSKDVLKYFKVRKKYNGAPGELAFTLRDDVVEAELAHKGWLVCISNRITDAEQAIRIYRDKDVTEKGHFRTKDLIGLHRLRVHADSAAKPLLLVGFFALVLQMWVHIRMDKANLYKTYTMDEMFRTVATHIVHVVKGERIVSPSTSKQKEIYKAMGCKVPS